MRSSPDIVTRKSFSMYTLLWGLSLLHLIIKMSVEGSSPLSHNSIENNEKAAAAISDVTDSLNINHQSKLVIKVVL